MLDLSKLNPQQRLAVETINGPVLILAGAGTGKTRVITHRVAHLIAKGVSPENILAVTFTNKAAREMQERATKLLPRSRSASGDDLRNKQAAPRPTICTFHSLCTRILRQHIHHLGYKRSFVIYDESDQLGAIKKILASISAKGEKTDPGAILRLLSRFKNGGERAAVFADPSVRAMAEHVRKRYESALHACNAVDFDDLILLVLRLFDEHKDVLEACRARYRYVMVDEYQDTNAAQFQLVHNLTVKHRNFCVVGDDDQSIYGWRGAEIANLLDMEKHFPEVKVIKLEQNYRSTNTILNAANSLIKNNVRRRPKQLWSQKGQGEKIRLSCFTDDEDEARSVVAQIEFGRMAHRVPWAHNAVLFRTNQQSRPLETALRQANVRYYLIGGQSFFDRREVRDLLAYLKVFLNPHDDVSLLRIANVPARGLSDVTMERLLGASHERKASVFTTMKNPAVTATFQARTREAIEAFVHFAERTRDVLKARPHPGPLPQERENRGQSVGESGTVGTFVRRSLLSPLPGGEGQGEGGRKSLVSRSSGNLQAWADHFLDEIGYYAELRRSEKNVEAAENRVRNLKDFIATMDASRPAGGALFEGLESFLEDVSLDNDREEEEETKGDAVTLITMHSCKGLEFPRVYIVGLEDGLLPHSRSKTEGTLDEERRLFYVAVTRAMQTLTISHCGGRKKYGQVLPCHPSPFLKELPPELVEYEDENTHRPVSAETGRNLFAAMREAAQ
jgi:superfamily I DNA/RNA helicase